MVTDRILFIYNAESGLFNGLADYAHKVFSPSTYKCALCALTYGNLGMRAAWKRYVHKLDTETIFLHRDEFRQLYAKQLGRSFPDGVQFPVIFAEENKQLRVLVNTDELALCKTLEDLKDLLTSRLI